MILGLLLQEPNGATVFRISWSPFNPSRTEIPKNENQ